MYSSTRLCSASSDSPDSPRSSRCISRRVFIRMSSSPRTLIRISYALAEREAPTSPLAVLITMRSASSVAPSSKEMESMRSSCR